ncbi:hypothetical protein TNIN_193961 [Trichonephila inaurata madagascariensis]|uniref:Uncharacterized protein n=1 Tax=Trichonephila inaurata madagascariensis TaxID=2747483 RepID=A0A8X6X8N7_9ARAC|nr:hypothetical protein TNIN_193961 [Trichonephila inaurata madagascariensis]
MQDNGTAETLILKRSLSDEQWGSVTLSPPRGLPDPVRLWILFMTLILRGGRRVRRAHAHKEKCVSENRTAAGLFSVKMGCLSESLNRNSRRTPK